MLVFVGLASAEIPQLISYQGRLTDGIGNPVPDTHYSILFTIYNNSETIIWQETHASVTTSDGLFNVLLGAGDHSGFGNLDESIFSDSIRWLGIKVGEDPEISPRSQLVSVPYAVAVGSHTHGAGDISPQGSGSGLDADMLDGQHASHFADTAHSHSWTAIQSLFHFVTFKPGSTAPIAFASILSNGHVQSGSGNVSCTYNNTYNRYEITITSESYHIYNYATTVTVTGGSPKIATTSSNSGMLLVYIWEL
jgi:hypothetical protein